MTQKQRKSRDKAAGSIPTNDGVGGEGKGRSEGGGKRKRHGGASEVTDSELVGKSDLERESKGKAEMKKKKKKDKNEEEVNEKESGGDNGKGKVKGNKDGEVGKGGKKVVERRADGDGGEGKLEAVVNQNKKKKKIRGTEDEKAEREKKEGGEKGAGGKINGWEDMTKKGESAKKSKENRGSKNGSEDRLKAIASSLEAPRFEEDEVRKSSKKQSERKDKDVEKNEGDVDDAEKKPGEESGLLKKQKQRNGNENADEKLENGCKSNCTVSQSDPSLVLSLSRSMQKSRRDSPTKKNKEKAEGNGKKLSEQKSQSKKRKTSAGEIKDSSAEEEPKEGAKKAEKGKRDGSYGVKKKRTSGEKGDEKDSKSCRLPLNRVRTIIRSHNLILKVAPETFFLICRATECFIEKFCEDAFELAASHGLSKFLKYEHLSSLVYNMDRYDFLSDYVPQKIKAKDALAEAKASESS